MESNKPKRKRKKNSTKAKSRQSGRYFNQEYKKIKKTKEGLSTKFLNKTFKNMDNFIGVFPLDGLERLSISNLPVKFIINLDLSNKPGSHWIGIYITDKIIEIYDSLGFKNSNWGCNPKRIKHFLRKYRNTHHFFITPQLQSKQSFLCGFYCIYFFIFRKKLSFNTCLDTFSSNLTTNDKLVLEQLFNL